MGQDSEWNMTYHRCSSRRRSAMNLSGRDLPPHLSWYWTITTLLVISTYERPTLSAPERETERSSDETLPLQSLHLSIFPKPFPTNRGRPRVARLASFANSTIGIIKRLGIGQRYTVRNNGACCATAARSLSGQGKI